MVELSAAACPDLGARKAQPLIVADHRLVEDLAFELDARVCAAEQQQQRHAAEAAAHADDLSDRRARASDPRAHPPKQSLMGVADALLRALGLSSGPTKHGRHEIAVPHPIRPGATRIPIVSYSYSEQYGAASCLTLNANARCNNDIILITNCSHRSAPAAPIGCYDWGANVERSGAAAILRKHPGPPTKYRNSKTFEMASIIRWAFLAQLVADLDLSAVVFVDCDVRVYSDLAALHASHPILRLADLAITDHNGAISIWRREAIDSFANFLATLVTTCDNATLQRDWYVDMGIISAWQRLQTDIGRNGVNGSRPSRSPCAAPLPVRHPPFRTINLDLLPDGAWPLQRTWPVPSEWRFKAGYVGEACPPAGKSKRNVKGCQARLAVNCSDAKRRSNEFQARVAPLPLPNKAPQLVQELYRVPGAREGSSFCTPFLSDGCGTLVPFHIAHFTGRFKYYRGLADPTGWGRTLWSKGLGADCECLRSWTNVLTAAKRDAAVLISHPTAKTDRFPN